MWEKLCSSVVSVLDFNQATLSGSIDIICVRHKEVLDDRQLHRRNSKDLDSKFHIHHSCTQLLIDILSEHVPAKEHERWVYRSTPFHVRFGKAKLLKSREKIVSIYVNGELSNLTMKLGAAGEAFFGEETDCDDMEDTDNSPESSPSMSHAGILEGTKSSEDMMEYGCYACNSKYTPQDEIYEKSVSSTDQTKPVIPADNSDKKMEPEDIDKSDRSWSWEWGNIPRKQSEKAVCEDQILQFSLCGHLLSCQDEQLNSELFRANIVDWERLDADPALWYHASLVARFDKRPPYYQSKIALPLLASWIVFNKPLSGGAIEKLLKTSIVATSSSSSSTKSVTTPSSPVRKNFPCLKQRSASEINNGLKQRRHSRVSLRPTSDQLASLNLKLGANRITFAVSSSLQGVKSINATLYLWPSDVQIVISDVDGTITRSDALGQIMPILGRDWSHVGVAELFTKIRTNGYQVVYLTARAIGQADYTREYLFGLTQNEKEKLPEGPIFLSPDRLLPSFKREVITKSAYMFKIPALRDIRNLFPADHNPFYAGFGNNESDHRAYVSVGVPESRVFIINPSGIIRHVNSSYARTYETMSEIAEHMFPPCHANSTKSSEDERYNSFQFWNFPIHMDVAGNIEEQGKDTVK